MFFHVVHGAVKFCLQPRIESRLGRTEINIGDADLLEAQFGAPLKNGLLERSHIFCVCVLHRQSQLGSKNGNSIIAGMQSLPANIYSVASVRELDRITIDEMGVPGYKLMQRAAEATLSAARTRYPRASRWQIVCGGGNNGGDGYVLARLAAHEGMVVSVIALVEPESLTGDAATAFLDFAADGGIVETLDSELDSSAELIVDAMLGSGTNRDLDGTFEKAASLINAHAAPVVAMDVASGIDADTGKVLGTAVKADLTMTFVGLKPGLFFEAGPEYCGEVQFAGLGIDPDSISGVEPFVSAHGQHSPKRLLSAAAACCSQG